MKRLDGYMTNTWMPWDFCRTKTARRQDHGLDTAVDVPIGAVSLTLVNTSKSDDNRWRERRVWIRDYGQRVTKLHWDRKHEHLYIGLDFGKVEVLKVSIDDESANFSYQVIRVLHCSKTRITGITNNLKTVTVMSHPFSLRVIEKMSGKILEG